MPAMSPRFKSIMLNKFTDDFQGWLLCLIVCIKQFHVGRFGLIGNDTFHSISTGNVMFFTFNTFILEKRSWVISLDEFLNCNFFLPMSFIICFVEVDTRGINYFLKHRVSYSSNDSHTVKCIMSIWWCDVVNKMISCMLELDNNQTTNLRPS